MKWPNKNYAFLALLLLIVKWGIGQNNPAPKDTTILWQAIPLMDSNGNTYNRIYTFHQIPTREDTIKFANGNPAMEKDEDHGISIGFAQMSDDGDLDVKKASQRNPIEIYDTLIKRNPGQAENYFKRAILKSLTRDYAGSLKDHDMTIQLDPRNAQAYKSRASIKENLKDYDGALKDYCSYLKLSPRDGEGYVYRGVIYYKLGKGELACKDFLKARSLGHKDAASLYKIFCRKASR